ncbi:hypothetical protein NM680_07525 [Paracoccus sp. PS-1]|uniref:hypothetical protein n=1 Tax=unclassified Paracoccus (in: a-proteobacteria) TaxID=2688777 RepID=UPI0004903DB3|nr:MULTISPECIES: hypothetical protein [unclassified Paracoccus (in: a-proteobacteria)]MDQ7261646.1 hypothetical protein [Paracoccus sp. PS1]RQP07232.1 MAG: hypothetical protein D1H97_03545 [Paracoccus sp. BP8]
MSRTFSTSIALSALLAVLSAPVLAQETPPAAPPAAEAQAPVALPQALQDAGLGDVTSKRGPRGSTRIEGKLADGTQIDAMLDAEGQLRGLRARGEAALPQALIDQLVPQAVRDSAVFGELGTLQAVFSGERGVMLAGRDGDKNKVRAAFAQDGTLLRFGRGDADRGERHGKRHDDRRDKGFHHRGHDRREGHRDRHQGPRGDRGGERPAPGRDMPPAPAGTAPEAPAPQQQGALSPVQLDRGELRMALTSAGYSRIGEIMQDGPRVVALAVNPEGEPVAVELNPRGQVMREINR